MLKPIWERLKGLDRKQVTMFAVIAAVAVTGLSLMAFTRAATNLQASEAESGTLTGQSRVTNGSGASGNLGVRFGEAPSAPSIVKAIPGGTNLAVAWNASATPNIKGYEVYRNGSKVATLTLGSGLTKMEKQARLYLDTNVTRGTTYRYQVKTIAADGSTSGLSTEASATHPVNTTPTPTVSFEYTMGPAPSASVISKADLEAAFRRTFQTWYPKISDALAFPSYTPINSFIVETNPGLSAAGASGNRIGYNPNWINSNPSEIQNLVESTTMHEMTHAINAFGSNAKPAWLGEGIANWTGLSLVPIETELLSAPLADPLYDTARLNQGYGPGAAFIYYVQNKYKASFPRDISIAVHNNTYNANFLQSATGKTEAQLVEELRTSSSGTTGQIRNGNNCLQADSANKVMTVATCASSSKNQQWTSLFPYGVTKTTANYTTFWLGNFQLGTPNCLILSGSQITGYGCGSWSGQRWQLSPNGSLVNVATNQCLTAATNGSLSVSLCNGGADQRWQLP